MLAGVVPLLLLPWRRITAGAGHVARSAQTQAADDTWTLGSAMRHHAFWSLFCIFFFTGTGMFSISVQVVAYLVEVGFPPLQAATAWGFSGVLLIIGMLTVSWLDGLLGRRRAILLAYGLTITGILMLWALSRYPSIWLLAGFLLCFGSTMGSRGPLVAASAMSIFRGKRVGTIMGAITIGMGLRLRLRLMGRRPDPRLVAKLRSGVRLRAGQRRARHDAVSGGAGAAAVTRKRR